MFGPFVAYVIDDLSSIIGVLIALIGFSVTIRNVLTSKQAAGRAESAANRAVESVRHIDTVHNLSKAISLVEEIKKLNRDKEWKFALDRHSTFRDILIEVKGAITDLDNDHQANLDDGITKSTAMSDDIEVALEKNKEPTDIARMNNILSRQAEKLKDMSVAIRMRKEEKKHGLQKVGDSG